MIETALQTTDTTLNFHDVRWLECHDQRLGLLPSAGGGVAAWQWLHEGEAIDLWRPWDGHTEAMNSLANYPMVPWSNRITGGGFEHRGVFHPIAPNTTFDPHPMHGDGWQQRWQYAQTSDDSAEMTLESNRFRGNPHAYAASQVFKFAPNELSHMLSVRNCGDQSMPFGLGLHPWFERTRMSSVQAGVDGVWLSGADCIPYEHTNLWPSGWNLNATSYVDEITVDNAFSGWNRMAALRWPERSLQIDIASTLVAPRRTESLLCLVYSPSAKRVFCFEPVTHPVNAVHLPGQPGWTELQPGESMSLSVVWRFGKSVGERSLHAANAQ